MMGKSKITARRTRISDTIQRVTEAKNQQVNQAYLCTLSGHMYCLWYSLLRNYSDATVTGSRPILTSLRSCLPPFLPVSVPPGPTFTLALTHPTPTLTLALTLTLP